MKNFTLRFSIGIFTFIFGVIISSFLLFDGYLNSSDYTISPIDNSQNVQICPLAPSDKESDENQDYAVYSAILAKSFYKHPLIIINEYTSHGLIADAQKIYIDADLSKDTIEDYQVKNQEDLKLENLFQVEDRIIFLSEKQQKGLFGKGLNSWDRFYKKYPEANGLIILSRIGFNQDKTQALVSVSKSCGSLCGEGRFIFLIKENDTWVIKQDIGLWVS